MIIEGLGTALDGVVVSLGIAWLPLIMGAGSLIKGWMGDKKKQQTQSTSTSTGQGASSSTPTIAPWAQGLQQSLVPMITERLMNPKDYSAGIERTGVKNINRTYDLAEQSLGNNLAARGMSRSGMAGAAEGRLAGARAGDIVNLQESLPLIQRQMHQEDIGTGMNLMNMARGTNQTHNYNQTGTGNSTTTTGGPGGFAGATGGLIDMLGYMYGAGMFGGGKPPLPSGPSPIGGLPGFPGTVGQRRPSDWYSLDM